MIAETRVVGFTFFKDAILLPSDPYGQYGPKLDDILNRSIEEITTGNAPATMGSSAITATATGTATVTTTTTAVSESLPATEGIV